MGNTFINRKNSQEKQHEDKIKELHSLLEQEAKKVSDAIEATESVLVELGELKKKKSALESKISELEGIKREEESALNKTIERKTAFIETAKQELVKERSNLKEIRLILKETKDSLENLSNVSKELKDFITRESDARAKWLDKKQKLEKVDEQYDIRMEGIAKEVERSVIEKRELDKTKNYLTDLYGKIATYVKTANETIKNVNNFLKTNKIPIEFKSAEVEKITLDNFSKLNE